MALVEKTQATETRAVPGTTATGSFRCTGCGNTVTVRRSLGECEHCSGGEWVAAPWSPFSNMRG